MKGRQKKIISGELKEQRMSVKKDRDFTTNRISDLSRYISFGILIAIFSVLTSPSIGRHVLAGFDQIFIFLSAVFAILTIIFDYVQYVAGYISSSAAYDNVGDDFEYEDSSCSNRLRAFSFWVKQVTTLISAILFCITLWALIF